MSRIKVFFDTNILVYAHDAFSNYHLESALLLKMALERNIQGVIAEQNIFELYKILTNPVAMTGKPLKPLQARDLITKTYLNGAFEVVYPTNVTTDKTLLLAVKRNVTSAKIFDIRLTALSLDTNVNYLATQNISDFQDISGLSPLTPKQILEATQVQEGS